MCCPYELMCVKQGIEEEDCSLVQLYIILYIYCVLEARALMLVEIPREIHNVHVCSAQSEVFRMSYLRISTPGMFTSLVPRPRPPCREKEGLIPCAAFVMSVHVCICMCVYVYVYAYVCMRICVYVCVYVYVCICMCIMQISHVCILIGRSDIPDHYIIGPSQLF